MGILDDLKKAGKAIENEGKKVESAAKGEAGKIENTASDDAAGIAQDFKLIEKIWPKIRNLINQMRNPHTVTAHELNQLTDLDLASLPLDAVQYFNLLTAMGEAMAEKIAADPSQGGVPFSADFVTLNPATGQKTEILVTRKGDTFTINKQMGDPNWVDRQVT